MPVRIASDGARLPALDTTWRRNLSWCSREAKRMKNFTPIRNGIVAHIEAGRLCPFDLGVYLLLHLRADWATGICHTCAGTLAYAFGDASLKPKIQKALRRLRDKEFLNYRNGDGSRGAYPILINKYQVTVGELFGKRLNAWTHGDLCRPHYETENGERTVEERRKNSQATAEEPNQDFRLQTSRTRQNEPVRKQPQGLSPKPIDQVQLPPELDEKAGQEKWAAALVKLSGCIDRHSFDNWLGPTRGLGLSDGILYVGIPTNAHSYIGIKYGVQIKELLPDVRVEFLAQKQEVRAQ
jgi:hypothetical protein